MDRANAQRASWISWLLAASALGALPLLGPSCLVKLPDGETCEGDDECKSEVCLQGTCAGSHCTDDGDCNDAWRCIYYPPNAVDDFLNDVGDYFTGNDDGANGTNLCTATCGNCPSSQHCDSSTDNLCALGPPLPVVTLDPVAQAPLGETVTLQGHGEIESGSITTWQWEVSDVLTEGAWAETITFTTEPPTLTYAWHQRAAFPVTLTAISALNARGSADILVDVCGPAGAVCYDYYGCCNGSCVDETCQ